MSSAKKILIIRTDRIGDVVLTLPLAGIIKKAIPDSEVTFLLREYTAPLVRRNPNIDKIITLADDPRFLSFGEIDKVFDQNQFDAAVFVSPALKTAVSAFKNGVRRRIGTGYRWYSFLFNEKIYQHRKYGEKHELLHNVEMLEKLDISADIQPGSVDFCIQSSEENGQVVENLIGTRNEGALKQILVHPGSGGSAVDLPISKMKELVKLLAGEERFRVFVTGSEAEFDICEQVAGDSGAVNLAGKLDLDALIALIGQSDGLIANSTGPLHIAAAMGKFVTGFFPKVPSCSVRRWGPFTENRLIFEPEIDCQNCTTKQCAKLECMSSIDVGTVFEKILEKL